MEISTTLANMSIDGAPEWDIQPVSFPVNFGRYCETYAKSFDRIDQTKGKSGKKHDFMYSCSSETFQECQSAITSVNGTLVLESTD